MECPACNCEHFIHLGTLGSIAYLRCRNCGIDIQTDVSALFDELENES